MFWEYMPGEMPDKLEYRNIGQEKYEKISQTHAVRWTVRLWFSTCQIKCQIECHLECQNTWQICQIEGHYLYIYIYQIICQQAIAILCICSLMGITRSKNFESSSMVFLLCWFLELEYANDQTTGKTSVFCWDVPPCGKLQGQLQHRLRTIGA